MYVHSIIHNVIIVWWMFPFLFLSALKVQLEYRDSGLLYSLEQLQFEEGQLGEGAFGVVRKAQLKMTDTETVTVAVKALKGMH